MIRNHPFCPENHPLVVRQSKYGKFFGCITFPEHKIIVEQPYCSKEHIMKLRNGPYGEFFGCIEYPRCKETYNFETQDSKYHARLWKDYENYLSINRKSKKLVKSYLSDVESKYAYKQELKIFIDNKTDNENALKDKNHPDLDMRIYKNLTEEEISEYNRLYNSEYSNHILLKIPEHLLKSYLHKSMANRRVLS